MALVLDSCQRVEPLALAARSTFYFCQDFCAVGQSCTYGEALQPEDFVDTGKSWGRHLGKRLKQVPEVPKLDHAFIPTYCHNMPMDVILCGSHVAGRGKHHTPQGQPADLDGPHSTQAGRSFLDSHFQEH
eukprot:CAMPEP_0117698954 /NCGR_PEP_ID=MMETSP0804-20121206/30022_1 /TAXON_ID=1074897 /ORGANISM="Tetraselmis astigmatica, Strain CCMP880" /LENGTH=129 /DNA_ID=CAMNT_0005513275 /DNA_START=619 /DNA_END=1009 /DNA_ORIENTATION=-